MSVYVDQMQPCIPNKNWPYKQACHLVADTVVELQEFARLLNLHPSWFQNKPELPHYDLVNRLRQKAVRMGAVEIDGRKIAKLMQKYRLCAD